MSDVLPRLVLEGRMRGVEVLDVYNLTWAELSSEAVRALTEGFSFASKDGEKGKITTIKGLRVGTCYWECVHDFLGFVCSPSFAGLKTLVCDSVLLNCGAGSCQCRDVLDATLNSSRESALAEISQALECLYLELPEEKMLKWFVRLHVVRGIEKLGLVVREKALMELVGQLVGRVTKVKELALDLPIGMLNFRILLASVGTDKGSVRLWFVPGEQFSVEVPPCKRVPVFVAFSRFSRCKSTG
jgi:hypothetical protein